MQQLILVLHVLVAIAIIALVLLQHGRGADVGASFGSGSSNTMFGSAGSVPFLMKVTAVCAALFFTTSILLSYMATHRILHEQMMSIPVTSSSTTKAPTKALSPAQTTDASGFSFAPTTSTTNTKK